MKTILIILAVWFVCNIIHGSFDHEMMKEIREREKDE